MGRHVSGEETCDLHVYLHDSFTLTSFDLAAPGCTIQVVMDQETGKPRGFGFVTFEDLRDAQDAVAEARGKVDIRLAYYTTDT